MNLKVRPEGRQSCPRANGAKRRSGRKHGARVTNRALVAIIPFRTKQRRPQQKSSLVKRDMILAKSVKKGTNIGYGCK